MFTSRLKILLLLLLSVSFIGTYFAGFITSQFVHDYFPSPIESPTNTPMPIPLTLNPVPGYQFYSDGFYILSKDDVNIGFVVSVDRHQKESSFTQSTRIAYFNGSNPVRYTISNNISDLSIHPDKYITSWQTAIDPSRVLKEASEISFNLPNTQVSLSTGDLTNEAPVRSLPGYTKFFSNGDAKFSINGKEHSAYIVYYHLNSNNSSDIYFYTKPLGITTHLLVLWNENGESYIVDSTQVSRPEPLYTSHKIGLFIDANKTVFRTFAPTIISDSATPPSAYKFTFPSPINSQIDLTKVTSISKSASPAEDWYQSVATGLINQNGKSTTAKGFIEYIHDN